MAGIQSDFVFVVIAGLAAISNITGLVIGISWCGKRPWGYFHPNNDSENQENEENEEEEEDEEVEEDEESNCTEPIVFSFHGQNSVKDCSFCVNNIPRKA